MFPPRATSTASSASDPLNGPPPSPQAVGGGPTGAPTNFSLSAVAPPVAPDQMPAEMLSTIISSAQQIGTMLDSYAQAVPQLAADFAAVKDQLQAVLAQLLSAGAGAASPTATGQQFPAAFSRGTAGAGAV